MDDFHAAKERMIEERKASALRLLAPLGFVDNNDGEAPGTIFHPGTSLVLDTSTVTPAQVVAALVAEGERRGREEVAAAMRRLIGVAAS